MFTIKEIREIECRSTYGSVVSVPINNFVFRPSVYGIILNKDHILLVNHRRTNKKMLPGGGVEPGEVNEAALKREVKEETGIEVVVQEMLQFTEHLFYHDPHNQAYHGLYFYYKCLPLVTEIPESFQVNDEQADSPDWYPISNLYPEMFHNNGRLIADLINRK